MARRGALAPTRRGAQEIELDDSFWRHARLIPALAPRKSSVHLRIDSDVLDWFKAQGKGHLTRMNAVLRAYVYAQQNGPLPSAAAPDPKRRRPAKSAAAVIREQKKTGRP